MPRRRNTELDFWQRVKPQESGCWHYDSAPFAGSGHIFYHGFMMNNVRRTAHRMMWEIAYGQVPQGLWVLHHCDNPHCVNPSHLFLGTRPENNIDAARKGRMANSKLTLDEVREIRRLYSSGVKNKEIRERFGVSSRTVYGIGRGEYRKHVT